MKKILLASTILVGTAGFAAAENANFTFSGSAYTGAGYTDAGGGTFGLEVTAAFTVGMMTTTDMGLEAGANITIDAGGVSFEDDHTSSTDIRPLGLFWAPPFLNPRPGYPGDWSVGTVNNFASLNTGDSGISDAAVYLSGDWGRVDVAYDADGTYRRAGVAWPFAWIPFFDDPRGLGAFPGNWAQVDTYDVTITYSNTWGDFGIEAYYVVAPGGGQSNGDAGLEATYTMGDYSVFGRVEWDADNVTYDLFANTGDWEVTLGGSAAMAGFNLAAEVEYDNWTGDWDWLASASYTTGMYTVGGFAEDEGADDQIDFGVNGSVALGGGVSIDAAVIYDNDSNNYLAKGGVTMAF